MSDLGQFLPGLIWAVPFAALQGIARRTPDLAKTPPAFGVPVSIIIPARNEAATIDTVIASILATTYDDFELIVVDDRSTDDTAQRIRRHAALARGRIVIIDGAELPQGWLGKPWACAQGASVARGKYLIFTDSDTRHAPQLLSHAVGALESGTGDLLTVTSQQRCVSFWERVIMPQIWLLLGLRYAPHRVNRATRVDQVIANGQFIMVPRASYDQVGGHAAVSGDVVEDLALAQAFVRSGLAVRMMFAETLLETRMYRSLHEMTEGWSKNLYLGSRQSFVNIPLLRTFAPLALFVPFLFWLTPFAMLIHDTSRPSALAAIGCSVLFWMLVCFGMKIPAGYGVAYPIGAFGSLMIAIRSVWRGARRVEWRGRRYDLRRGR